MKKIIILVAIVLLTIGFESITTSLILNGTLKVKSNADDYKVYF